MLTHTKAPAAEVANVVKQLQTCPFYISFAVGERLGGVLVQEKWGTLAISRIVRRLNEADQVSVATTSGIDLRREGCLDKRRASVSVLGRVRDQAQSAATLGLYCDPSDMSKQR